MQLVRVRLSVAAATAQPRHAGSGRHLEHQRGSRALPRSCGAEIARLVADVAARRGQVTPCPAAVALPVQNSTASRALPR